VPTHASVQFGDADAGLWNSFGGGNVRIVLGAEGERGVPEVSAATVEEFALSRQLRRLDYTYRFDGPSELESVRISPFRISVAEVGGSNPPWRELRAGEPEPVWLTLTTERGREPKLFDWWQRFAGGQSVGEGVAVAVDNSRDPLFAYEFETCVPVAWNVDSRPSLLTRCSWRKFQQKESESSALGAWLSAILSGTVEPKVVTVDEVSWDGVLLRRLIYHGAFITRYIFAVPDFSIPEQDRPELTETVIFRASRLEIATLPLP